MANFYLEHRPDRIEIICSTVQRRFSPIVRNDLPMTTSDVVESTEATTTTLTSTTTVDPVEEVANDPELQKQLLKKLLIQDVAIGDTKIMEIIKDVDRKEDEEDMSG